MQRPFAEAICEAVTRPNMRFVPIKNVEQQGVLALHTVRQGFVTARTAQANQIRGLLSEFGLIVPQGIWHITKEVPDLLEDASNELPGAFRLLNLRLIASGWLGRCVLSQSPGAHGAAPVRFAAQHS